jgi:hypothetical protein
MPQQQSTGLGHSLPLFSCQLHSPQSAPRVSLLYQYQFQALLVLGRVQSAERIEKTRSRPQMSLAFAARFPSSALWPPCAVVSVAVIDGGDGSVRSSSPLATARRGSPGAAGHHGEALEDVCAGRRAVAVGGPGGLRLGVLVANWNWSLDLRCYGSGRG